MYNLCVHSFFSFGIFFIILIARKYNNGRILFVRLLVMLDTYVRNMIPIYIGHAHKSTCYTSIVCLPYNMLKCVYIYYINCFGVTVVLVQQLTLQFYKFDFLLLLIYFNSNFNLCFCLTLLIV